MALEDVLNAGQNYVNISAINGGLQKDPYNPEIFNHFLRYTQRAGEPLTREELNLMAEELRKDPVRLRQITETAREADKRTLTDIVSREYKELIKSLPEKVIPELAINIPDKDKKFYDIVEKLEQKDYEGARKAYAETFDNRVWKEFIGTANIDFIKKYAERYIEVQKLKFLDKFASEKTVKGKKGKYVDAEKLRKYLAETVADYTDDKDKEQAYLMLGQTYALSQARENNAANEQEDNAAYRQAA